MSKNKQELATEVLRELRLVRRAGGVPNAADAQTVMRRYDGLYEELGDRGKAFWDIDAIPERVFPALVRLVAGECAAAFGVEYNDGGAYQRLTVLASDEGDGQPVRVEYF